MNRTSLAIAALVLLGACANEAAPGVDVDVPGPASVQVGVIEDHAASFEAEVPEREAGSQQEQVAASYITGTLQQNGYIARLESVPVGDLVRSTNVIGVPGGSEEPTAVVVVPYGTGSGGAVDPVTVGLFLELARALNVETPGHNVYFVALGAEFADEEGGNLGSRRLVRFMLDEGWDPLVIQLLDVAKGEPIFVSGAGADDLIEMMTASTGPFTDYEEGELTIEPDVFQAGGFERMLISGDPEKVGEALIDYLRRL